MVESDDLDEPSELAEMPRGIFTDADRRFLDMTPEERREESFQYVNNRETAIGERLQYGLIDLKNALHKLPHELRREAFDELFQDVPMWSKFQFITGCMGFLFLGYMEHIDEDLDETEKLEDITERALNRMYWRSDQRIGVNTANPEAKITVEGWADFDHYERDMDPADMTERQLHGMYVMGELTQEEFAKAVLADSSKGD